MKIVAVCGAGVGTSGILKINVERVLQRLGLKADVVAVAAADLPSEGEDAQIILATPAYAALAREHRYAEVIVIENVLDTAHLTGVIEHALG